MLLDASSILSGIAKYSQSLQFQHYDTYYDLKYVSIAVRVYDFFETSFRHIKSFPIILNYFPSF